MNEGGKTLTVRQVAELIGGRVEGDGAALVRWVGSVDEARPDELTFAGDERYAAMLATSKAAAAVVPENLKNVSAPMPLVRVKNVQAAMAKVLGLLGGNEDLPPRGIHPTAVVSPDASIGEDAAVGPGAVVGAGAKLGRRCVLCANANVGARATLGDDVMLADGTVVKYGCKLGNRVRIGPNSVIGWDGFGYYFADGVHNKIPHVGDVVIEDDVEIGACACVDRAKFGSTRIGAGTKIDNLVQIAHNVQIGRGCILVGQVGIAGSARLGQFVVLGGNAGVRDNVTIGNGVQCAAHSAIAADVPDGQVVAGTPAGPAREKMRQIMAAEKLPELLKRVKEIESRLNAIESAADNRQAR